MLFLALLLVMLRELNKSSFWFDYNHHACATLLTISFIIFIGALLILRQVAWVVIETKSEIAKKQREQDNQSTKEAVTPISE